jgi:tRNA pseudouridine38-40 synthase
MTRWLVRFGYDGLPFAGWARQPGLRTVEGELLRGVVRCGIAPSASAARVEVASRTDRGVSARGNALALTSELAGSSLLRALNGVAPEIFFREAAAVSGSYRVRSATWREYRYYLPAEERGIERWSALLPEFTKRSIDVRSFARGVLPDRPCWRDISEFELLTDRERVVLRLRAPSFLWGMVRKIVAALRGIGSGEWTRESVSQAIAGERRIALPLAPAEPLVLWEVRHEIPWTVRAPGWTERQASYIATESSRAKTRASLLPELLAS